MFERIRHDAVTRIDNSIVVHKTRENYFARPQSATGADAWKFYCQARNTTYIKKKKGVLLTFLSNINKYRVFVHRLNKRQDKKGFIRNFE